MNALKCRTLATKILVWKYTPKQKFILKSIIIQRCVGDLVFFPHQLAIKFVLELVNLWTKLHRLLKNNLLWHRQSPRNKAPKIQKLAFRCFLLTSAKAKKFQDGDWSLRLYTTISLQLRRFKKNRHNFFIRRTHVLSSNGFKKKQNEVFSKITKWQTDRHTQQTDDDRSNRCRCATCYQCLAHLAETGKELKKWLLRLVK